MEDSNTKLPTSEGSDTELPVAFSGQQGYTVEDEAAAERTVENKTRCGSLSCLYLIFNTKKLWMVWYLKKKYYCKYVQIWNLLIC